MNDKKIESVHLVYMDDQGNYIPIEEGKVDNTVVGIAVGDSVYKQGAFTVDVEVARKVSPVYDVGDVKQIDFPKIIWVTPDED